MTGRWMSEQALCQGSRLATAESLLRRAFPIRLYTLDRGWRTYYALLDRTDFDVDSAFTAQL